MNDSLQSSVIPPSLVWIDLYFVVEGFDFCETRQYEWSDVATIHQNHSNTYLWRFRFESIFVILLIFF